MYGYINVKARDRNIQTHLKGQYTSKRSIHNLKGQYTFKRSIHNLQMSINSSRLKKLTGTIEKSTRDKKFQSDIQTRKVKN